MSGKSVCSIRVTCGPRPPSGAVTDPDQTNARRQVVPPLLNEAISGRGSIAPRIPKLRTRPAQFHTMSRIKYERQWGPGPIWIPWNRQKKSYIHWE